MKNFSLYLVSSAVAFTQMTAEAFERNVLLEEFTTEQCNWCPQGYLEINDIMTSINKTYPGRVNLVAHHSGFNKDWLTTQADLDLLELYYGFEGTFAPGCAINRIKYEDDPCIVLPEFNDDVMGERIRHLLNTEADGQVSISYDTDYDKTWVNVTVRAERNSKELLNDARITVYLVENNVTPRLQQGAYDGFTHQHVIRAYNSVWGEPVIWNGLEAEYNVSFDIDMSWLPDNLTLVAFLNEYDENNNFDREIYNSASVSFNGEAGIENVMEDSTPLRSYFIDLNGVHHSVAPKGVSIKVIEYSDGTILTEKILIH